LQYTIRIIVFNLQVATTLLVAGPTLTLWIHTQVLLKQCCFSSSQDSLEEQQMAIDHQ